MFSQLFLGVDIGTSGVKAAIFDVQGNQISFSYQEYQMVCTEPRMAELIPDEIFNSFIKVIRTSIENLDFKTFIIEAIGLSTQLFSLLATDTHGQPLTNVFTWADTRSIKQADDIKQNFDFHKMYNSTGCRTQHPMYPISKILWLKATKPELYQNVYKFLSIKEYILFRLFGEYVIDITDASTTGCFNIHNFQWDNYIMQNVLAIDDSKFGQTKDCLYILKNIKPEYAIAMGIERFTPVVIGSGDGMLANLGSGVIDNASMSCTIGTSGALRISVPKPILDPEQRTWCYCFTKDTWVAGGAINNGGIVLKWLRDNYKEQFQHDLKHEKLDDIYQLFDKYAAEITPGSDGLIFLPFLTGERSPNWNANAKGIIYGIQLIHDKKHFIRSAMEGIIYRMFSVYDILTQLNGGINHLKASGGYTNSDVWLQIQADIFKQEIIVNKNCEASSLGAAYMAMVAVGAASDLTKILPVMQGKRIIKPIPENMKIYDVTYQKFRELYEKLIYNHERLIHPGTIQ